MTFFCRLNNATSRLEEILIGVLLASASLVLFLNVVARYVFNWGVPWAEELVRYEIVWMVFIGTSVAARKGIHIGVDLLGKFSPPAIRRFVVLTINAISLMFCLSLVVIGSELVAQTRMFGQVTPALQIPMWTMQVAIPIGAALMSLRFLQRMIADWNGRDSSSAIEDIG